MSMQVRVLPLTTEGGGTGIHSRPKEPGAIRSLNGIAVGDYVPTLTKDKQVGTGSIPVS